MSRISLVDLPALHQPLEAELTATFQRVLRSGRFVLGPEVLALEAELAAELGVAHAIGVSSGTDALTLALEAVGVGPGDRVITSAFSFYSTAGVIARLGAVPVFADLDPATYNLDPKEVQVALQKGPARAILPVHLFGQAADLGPLLALGQAHQVPIIEDAAQALYATYPIPGRAAQPLGTLGALGCFSFFPTKNLGALGDGGLVVTNDPAYAATVRSLRTYGATHKHRHERLGANFRLDEMQAALLRVKRPHLDRWNQARRQHALAYQEGLADLPLGLPQTPWGPEHHVFHQYVIRVEADQRDQLRAHLAEAEIDTEVYYPVPLSEQPCFQGRAEVGELGQTRRAAAETLALPVHPTLGEAERSRVIAAVRRFFLGA